MAWFLSCTYDRARRERCAASEHRAHLLEEALRVALPLLVGLIDLLRHELLCLTHCCCRGDLNARESRSELLLRLGEVRLGDSELSLEARGLGLELLQLLLQLLDLGLICSIDNLEYIARRWR